MKRDYAFRLETPERAAAEGLRQVSLGVLLGLTDFRVDAYYLGQHAAYLQKKYWKTLIGLSFPRIRQAAGDFQVPSPVSDPQFVQLVTALRLFLPDAPFSLSTRETAELRNHLLPLGFTQISAGSSTEPGGYPLRKREIAPGISPNKEGFDPLVDVSHPNVSSGAQFHVEDQRSPKEISELLVRQGFEPVWKDWEVF
jgi:2-iminoacetate synthase